MLILLSLPVFCWSANRAAAYDFPETPSGGGGENGPRLVVEETVGAPDLHDGADAVHRIPRALGKGGPGRGREGRWDTRPPRGRGCWGRGLGGGGEERGARGRDGGVLGPDPKEISKPRKLGRGGSSSKSEASPAIASVTTPPAPPHPPPEGPGRLLRLTVHHRAHHVRHHLQGGQGVGGEEGASIQHRSQTPPPPPQYFARMLGLVGAPQSAPSWSTLSIFRN